MQKTTSNSSLKCLLPSCTRFWLVFNPLIVLMRLWLWLLPTGSCGLKDLCIGLQGGQDQITTADRALHGTGLRATCHECPCPWDHADKWKIQEDHLWVSHTDLVALSNVNFRYQPSVAFSMMMCFVKTSSMTSGLFNTMDKSQSSSHLNLVSKKANIHSQWTNNSTFYLKKNCAEDIYPQGIIGTRLSTEQNPASSHCSGSEDGHHHFQTQKVTIMNLFNMSDLRPQYWFFHKIGLEFWRWPWITRNYPKRAKDSGRAGTWSRFRGDFTAEPGPLWLSM